MSNSIAKLLCLLVLSGCHVLTIDAFATTSFMTTRRPTPQNEAAIISSSTSRFANPTLHMSASSSSDPEVDNGDAADYEAKFGMGQRIASVQSLVVGALAGGLALCIPALLHQTVLESLFQLTPTGGSVAQFEFDNDMGSLVSGLFAIVYRYTIRMDGQRDQLKQGVVGAFTLTRTLSRIQVPATCSSVPLSCGAPLGYFNWNMVEQGAVNGLESAIMFAATAAAMDYCMDKGWISKFP